MSNSLHEEMMAQFRRVGIVTSADFELARPRNRPIGPLRQMMPPWMTAVLQSLPDGAGPLIVRRATELALAEYHDFPLPHD